MQSKSVFAPLALAAVVLAAGALPAAAEDTAGLMVVLPSDKVWQKNPKAFPYGAKMIQIYGDPAQPGPYMYRMRLATGYKFSPHKTPDAQAITLLKGILWFADGERYDPIRMKEYEAGSFFVVPAGQPTFLWARTEVVLQVMGNGPVENPVEYINPDDDPRN